MNLLAFGKRFGTEEDCVQYLKERREQEGLVGLKCGAESIVETSITTGGYAVIAIISPH